MEDELLCCVTEVLVPCAEELYGFRWGLRRRYRDALVAGRETRTESGTDVIVAGVLAVAPKKERKRRKEINPRNEAAVGVVSGTDIGEHIAFSAVIRSTIQ